MQLLAALLLLGLAAAEDLKDCGGAKYYPSQYTCYNGNFLCPKINGEATLKCGDSCYSPTMYTCTNTELKVLPTIQGPFYLVADNPTQPFNGKKINACNRHFWVGANTKTCTYCPDVVIENAGSCPPDNLTALNVGRGMSTSVPGGQAYYIEPNGALGFTQAHSAAYPTGSVFGVDAYSNGQFRYNAAGAGGWYACGAAGKYQIYQKLPNVALPNNCVGLYLLTKASPYNIAAWQYT